MNTFLASDGEKIAFSEHGSGSDPVVFLHGFLLSSKCFRDVIGRLDDRRCVAIDLRGFGESATVTEGFTTQRWADDVIELADHLGLERFTCIAHSMGGFFALRIAVDHPERLRAVVMSGGVPAHGAEGNEKGRELQEQAMAIQGNADAYRALFEAFCVRGLSDAELREMVDDAMLVGPAPFQAWGEATLQGFESEIDRIRAPFLFLASGADIAIPVGDQLRTAEQIPGARTVVLNDEGHLLPQENPDRFVSELRFFLDSLPA